MIVPVILAGGSGTRLWPLSRALYPKQLIGLIDERTLLQNTVLRLEGIEGLAAPVVLCNQDHRFMVAEQLRTIDVEPGAIVLEPMGRNTAPAVAVAVLQQLGAGEDPLLLVLPADHHIRDLPGFHRVLHSALSLAREGRLVTFGIVPNGPETGYGYIRKGAPVVRSQTTSAGDDFPVSFAIDRFVEKPNRPTAEQYVASGDYCWNSGMFLFRASTMLAELEARVPQMVTACKAALERGCEDLDFFRLERAAFGSCPADSIDYAVMEHTERGAVVPLDAGWSDLGSWEALWQEGTPDAAGNVCKGDVLTVDAANCYFHAAHRLVTAVGVTDHVVIETSDAVFVAPRSRVQDVKRVVAELRAKGRCEALIHRREYRPWGICEHINHAPGFQVKRLTVYPGAELSLQQHHHRAEHWVVAHGTAQVRRGDERLILSADQSVYIPIGMPHRLANPGRIPLEIIEVRTGGYLGEDDILRLEDIYGR